jgi:Flp pilus assembly protein TadD
LLAKPPRGVILPVVHRFLRLRNARFGFLSYKEVAVNRFTSFSYRVLVGLPLMAGALVALGGCSDVITYSKESRAIGETLYEQQNYSDAAGAFRNAIRQNPADYRSHYYLGACYAKDKAYNQATQQYQTALAIMPSTLEGQLDRPFRLKVLDGLAESLALSGDPQAETEAVAQGATSPEKYFLLAKVQRKLGDADAAVAAYRQAAMLDRQDFDISKEYSLYLMKLQDVRDADPELRHAYTLNDKDNDVNNALREIGVIPGPGLKPETALAKPIIPEGPIPMVDVTKIRLQNPFRSGDSAAATSSADTSQTPRD